MLRLRDLVVSSIVVGLLACSGGAEKTLLTRFFSAVRSADNATIVAMSAVVFPGGLVESWEMVEVSEETVEPFQLMELRSKAATARRERDVQFEKGKYFLEDNYASVEKIQLKLDETPDHKFDGTLGEVQAEWQKVIEDRKTLERSAQQFSREADDLAKLANMSLMTQANVNSLQGNVLTKDVLVSVLEEGGEKAYTITLQKYDLNEGEEGARALAARWIIVAIEDTAT